MTVSPERAEHLIQATARAGYSYINRPDVVATFLIWAADMPEDEDPDELFTQFVEENA